MSESLHASRDDGLARIHHEKVLAFYQSGAECWGEVLRAQLQIAQSMFAIGCAWALGARPKQLPLGDPRVAARRASVAVEPLPVTAVAKAQRPGRAKRRKMRRP